MEAFEPDTPPPVVFGEDSDDEALADEDYACEPIADTMADIMADSHRRVKQRAVKVEKMAGDLLKEQTFNLPRYGG
jgi:hypothetical protein